MIVEKCQGCQKLLTLAEINLAKSQLFEEYNCFECVQNICITYIANELREARITFEEVIRKILAETDR